MNLLNLGASGVAVARVNLEAASHNISNVSTEGYSRQVVSQNARLPQYNGFGFLGQGADVASISRMFDQFVEVELRTTTSNISSLQAQKNALGTIDNMLTDSSTGIMASVQQFFTAMQTAAANPTSIATRQVVLSEAQALVDRFQTTNSQIEELRQNLRSSVEVNVAQINTLSESLAKINREITILSDGNKIPNDLLDQRDKLVVDLNKLVNVNVVQSSNGSYNVFLDNGGALVVGGDHSTLSTQTTQSAINVFLDTQYAQPVQLLYSDLKGGTLHGNLQLLEQDIPRVQIDLGNLAIEFTDAVNRQHALGVDLTGQYQPQQTQNTTALGSWVAQTGGLFQDLGEERLTAELATNITDEALAMRLAIDHMSVKVGNPAQLAMASGVIAVPAYNADGTVAKPVISSVWQEAYLHNDNATPFTGSEPNARLNEVLPPPATIQIPFDASTNPVFGTPTASVAGYTFTAISKSSSQQGVWEFEMTAPAPGGEKVKLAFKAESLPLTGTQSLTIRARDPANDGIAGMDNSNMLAINALQAKPILASSKSGATSLYPKITDPGFTRTATMEVYFAQTVSYVGSRGSITGVQLQAQQNLNLEVTKKKEGLSGVDLDEEAANLVRFQQAYQASSKVIQVAQETFQSILDAVG
ncbi:flagellar hook-associated protein FlgK [Vogesella amnigena]|uniref:Flagellar hook-associated protein 1 n=1 Tax=Vogesella amnigena TaxID=1507449 RepID=A0ABV7TRK2_9NEIS